MSDQAKQTSNPFSTGAGGSNFENNVQTLFVVLMLSGGLIPCVKPWPIKKIKLQGRYAGYKTDDLIAFTEEREGGLKAKLHAQIKHSISITENDKTFGEVIQAAWDDFRDEKLFNSKYDAIALISGPLSALDIENTRILLEWARTSASADEFLDKVSLAKFSSNAKRNKLTAFKEQLKKANEGNDVDNETLWQFLKCFHILGYDLDVNSGVTLSLINSHIAQFTKDNGLWAKISKEVANFNQSAGTITIDSISEEIRTAFSQRLQVATIPTELLTPHSPSTDVPPDYFNDEHAEALMFASLLGEWNEKMEGDKNAIRRLIETHD